MNKKGMTLIEITIAISLISLIMIFVFNLLVDLRQEETISSYAAKDQLSRNEIINAVQDDLNSYSVDLDNITSSLSDNKLTFTIKLTSDDGSSIKNIIKYLIIDNSSGESVVTYYESGKENQKSKWVFKSFVYDIDNYKFDKYKDDISVYSYFLFRISAKDNLYTQVSFDLEIFYLYNTNI